MAAYYNDNDPFCAEWLRNLIAAGAIPAGDVDERSIADIDPADLRGFRQCHFFAGIGGWAYALELAGWPPDRPVWTGSCPCQPFSSAGRQGGALDQRHLWPWWLRLVRECRPDAILGEQVEGAVGFGWVDRVFADLEAEGYACGSAVLGAHSVGAPHIRQRLFWVAQPAGVGRDAWPGDERQGREPESRSALAHNGGAAGGLADADQAGSDRQRCAGLSANGDAPFGHDTDRRGEAVELADSQIARRQQWLRDAGCGAERGEATWPQQLAGRDRTDGRMAHSDAARSEGRLRGGPDTGRQDLDRHAGRDGAAFWNAAVWLPCLDGKARRTFTRLQLVASRLPTGMGARRTPENQAEMNDGSAEKGRPATDMRGLRSGNGAAEIQWRSGEQSRLQSSEVLQPPMHGNGHDRSHQGAAQAAIEPAPVSEDEHGSVRALWRLVLSSRPSQGRESAEQRSVEPGDVVHVLSHQRALADLEGDEVSAQAMQALSEACAASGHVRLTLPALSQAWRSVACAQTGEWAMGVGSPLAMNIGLFNRVGLLRGSGNAITPQVAAEFVRAFMECEP